MHLLMKDGFSLTTITRLLPIVAALSLCEQRVLALLVLRDLVRTMGDASRFYLAIAKLHKNEGTYVCFLQVFPLQSGIKELEQSNQFRRFNHPHVLRVLHENKPSSANALEERGQLTLGC
jgi:hypothetical protein